jgi:hypothetical protein
MNLRACAGNRAFGNRPSGQASPRYLYFTGSNPARLRLASFHSVLNPGQMLVFPDEALPHVSLTRLHLLIQDYSD